MFNDGFSSPLARIKILTVTNKVDNGEEAKDTQDRVDEDRRLITEVSLSLGARRRVMSADGRAQACIVRVMKTRQTLGFAELSTEVIAQLSRRFRPNPSVIKTAVEKLIEKEYLMRDPNDRKILTYLVRFPSTLCPTLRTRDALTMDRLGARRHEHPNVANVASMLSQRIRVAMQLPRELRLPC